MSMTNFAAQTQNEKLAWAMGLWKDARNHSFVERFTGKDANSMVQRVTEVSKGTKGVSKAVITLLADLVEDGVAGDRQLRGNEEEMRSFECEIRIDQLRHANHNVGRMNDQKSILNFRENSKSRLSYWFADRIDQMAFLTLAGLAYTNHPNGTQRAANSALPMLEFAQDVTAPTANRHGRWDATDGFVVGGGVSDVALGDTPTWNLIMELKKLAKMTYMRGLNSGGDEIYHCFLHPSAMLRLKQDKDYIDNLRHAQTRGGDNSLFTGTSVKIDGVVLHEFRHVPVGMFGAGSAVEGSFVLFCGAQSLATADLGAPYWDEEKGDYDNHYGISVGKIFGMKKPTFHNIYTGQKEDFGVIRAAVSHK